MAAAVAGLLIPEEQLTAPRAGVLQVLGACPRPVLLTPVNGLRRPIVQLEPYAKPCGSKSCGYCGPLLRRAYVAHYARLFTDLSRRGLAVYWVTLTLDPKNGVERWESRRYALHTFAKFRKRLARRGEVVYCVAPEEHKSGYCHLHALLASGLPAETIRAEWFASGGGIVVDVQPLSGLDIPRAIGYCLKYVFKDAVSQRGKGVRSLLVSQGYGYHASEEKEMRRNVASAKQLAEQGNANDIAKGDSEGIDEGRVVGWVGPRTQGKRVRRSDVATAEDKARWRRLRAERGHCLTRVYRTVEHGVWVQYSVRQLPDGDVVSERTEIERPETAVPFLSCNQLPR